MPTFISHHESELSVPSDFLAVSVFHTPPADSHMAFDVMSWNVPPGFDPPKNWLLNVHRSSLGSVLLRLSNLHGIYHGLPAMIMHIVWLLTAL